MMLCGDFSPEGNFAYKVDLMLLGRFRGDPTYTWIWSSLTFAVTVMLGTFALDVSSKSATRIAAVLCFG